MPQRFAAYIALADMKTKRGSLFGTFCWETYVRSFVLTLGLAFMATPVFVWFRDGNAADWPIWPYLVLLALFSMGATLLAVGIFAEDDRVGKWANDASTGGFGILIIMVAALPMYVLVSLFRKKRRGT